MTDGDAGGSGQTGQTTLGEGTRKLTPEEAGFERGKGIPGYRCGDCHFFENAKCRIVAIDEVYAGDVCLEFEPDRKGRMTSGDSLGTTLAERYDEFGDYDLAYVQRRKFSKEKRMQLAKSGKALPWGGFPIENCGDVKNAVRAIGRAKDRAQTIAHIKKHHSSLGCSQKLPASWKSMANAQYTAIGPLRRLAPVLHVKHLFITKVSEDRQTGEKRWLAKASGVERDLYDERMSVPLFKDFINRAEAREEVPQPFSSEAWNGGLPYLGIAHYLDMGGLGIVGSTDQLWSDGDLLKARGTFEDNPMAEAAYESIKADLKNKVPLEERVRISIAFIDWGHEHEGEGSFKRRSLSDRCKMCADGLGEKVYRAGHLVHLALTRIPAYPTATIELEEKSMAESAKLKDAASIVGDEHAEALEEGDRELVGRSEADIDPNAVVVKQDQKKAAGEEEDMEEDEDEDEEENSNSGNRYGGAKSLAEAEEFLVRGADGEPVLMDSLNVLAGVLTNIAGEEHAEDIRAELDSFQTRVDAETAKTLGTVRAYLEANMPEETEVVEEPQAEVAEAEVAPDAADAEVQPEAEPGDPHPLDGVFASLKAKYDEAKETPVDADARLKMLQEPVNELAMALKSSIGNESEGSAGLTLEAIQQVVQSAVAPIAQDVEVLKATVANAPKPDGTVHRAVQSGSLVEASSVARQEPEVPIMDADRTNPKTDKDVTPGLRGLVRRSVGLGG